MLISNKISVLTLIASLSLIASPVASNATTVDQGPYPYGLSDGAFYSLMFLTSCFLTSFALTHSSDEQGAQSLLDQAYAGYGEKLEAVASASGKSLEVMADTIVRLDQEGRISSKNPKAMAETVALELIQQN